MFPKFLLKKLYLKSSLKLTEEGFSFIIKNGITNGTVSGVNYLKFNEIDIAHKKIRVEAEGYSVLGDSINENNPFPLKKGVNTLFSVYFPQAIDEKGTSPKIGIKFKIKEIGNISFDFTDILS